MYIPRANEERRLPVLHQLIRDEPLAALVTMNTEGLFASHLPMTLVETDAPSGILRGHISRANPQWRDMNPSIDALAIFFGPQHYITPSWYPGKVEDREEVPTWNYVTVHAYGALQVIEDKDWLMAHLEHLSAQSEVGSPMPWKVSDAPTDFIHTMLNGIIGLELVISRLEGKWKVSQNRTVPDKQGVIEGLNGLSTHKSLTMRDLVVDHY